MHFVTRKLQSNSREKSKAFFLAKEILVEFPLVLWKCWVSLNACVQGPPTAVGVINPALNNKVKPDFLSVYE